MQIARWLHLLGVVVWVGGMFFAHMALRPSVQALDPPQRLPLLAATLSRFLTWVAVAVLLILGSGAFMVMTYGGFGAVRAVRQPLPMCSTEIESTYVGRADELGCVNPEFFELPDGQPNFRIFARITSS